MTAPAPIEFTDREIRLIIRSLPNSCDPQRLEFLPHILRSWASKDLPGYLWPEAPSAASERLRQIAKVGKAANDLIQAIGDLNEGSQFELALQIGIVEGLTFAAAVGRERENRVRLAKARNSLRPLPPPPKIRCRSEGEDNRAISGPF